jgi:hypothetical protein
MNLVIMQFHVFTVCCYFIIIVIIIYYLSAGNSPYIPETNIFLMCILLQLLCGYNLCYMYVISPAECFVQSNLVIT